MSDRFDDVRDRDVAVVGMAGRFPGARDLDALWALVSEGREAVTFLDDAALGAAGVPAAEIAHPDYVKAASLLDGVAEFDAGFFGYTAREAEIMDPQQRLFLEHAWAALEDAGCVPSRYEGLVGVYAGVAWNTYLLSNLREHRELFAGGGGFQVFITNDKDFMPTRVSYKLDLKGPSMIVQTSCSTSLVAIHLAALSLLNYECDLALAGGVTVKVPQESGYLYQDGGLASPDGHCRPFDERAAGTIFGSGVGVVALKRLADALADGDTIRAVVRGSAINNDGSVKVSYTAPSVEGQAEVVAAAQAVAEVAPETVRYVECHGTGTSLGDPIEVTALTKVFRESTARRGFCALGSIKGNVGHLDAAAGVAGFVKTVLALERRQVPPSVNYERPNPRIDFASSPFYVATALEPWETDGAPRRAGVSSFGVGGTNAHVVLEEAPPHPAPAASRPVQLLVLSARSGEALDAATARLAATLEAGVPAGGSLADVAWTLATGREVFRHRRFAVARDAAHAAALLAGGEGALPATADTAEPRQRPVAFLFPGQGAQHPGMGRRLWEREPAFRDELDRCAELLRPHLGLDLREAIFPAAEDPEAAGRLEATELAQPALFAVEWSLARLWREWGVEPAAMLGHSLGEYVAAALAGVFSLEDAVALVAARGRLMARAPEGAMLVVPLPEDEVAGHLGEELSVAAVNEPSRTTVSGPERAVADLAWQLQEEGVPSRRLHTSHGFHSALMDGVLDAFRAEVERVERSAPAIPFVSNVTGTWITAEEATDPDYWVRHLRRPVRFADGVAALLADSDRVLLEVGPGTTLATLARRAPERGERPVVSTLAHPRDAADDQATALDALGRLWLAGVEIGWDGFWAGERRRRLPLPTYPFERRRYWIDAGAAAERDAAAGVRSAAPGAGKRPDVADWFYVPSWEQAPPLPPAGRDELPERWLVLAAVSAEASGELAGAGAALAAALAARGLEPAVVVPGERFARLGADRWTLRPAAADDWAALAAELETEGRLPQAVVHAWSGAGPAARPPEMGTTAPAFDATAFDAAQETGLLALAALVRALAPHGPFDLTAVAAGLHRVTAAEPLRPELATLGGPCRVLPEELPGAACRTVDARGVAPSRLAEALLAEVAAARRAGEAAEEEIALRGAQRWVRRDRPVPLPAPAEPPLRDGGVFLVTGGLAGNGLALGRYLARERRARLLLVEDSGDLAAPEAEDGRQARLDALAELGGEVAVLAVDLADPAAVAAAADEAERRFGALHGVVHAAGTYGERTFRVLAETGRDEAAGHLRRVHALAALDRALAERAAAGKGVELAVVVGSLATAVGGLAYGAYAAANLALAAFAEERRRPGSLVPGSPVPWIALDWDVWRFEGESEEITRVRADLAELAMSPREGEEAFRRAAAAAAWADRLLVSTEDLSARRAGRRERIAGRAGAAAARAAAPGERHPRPAIATPYATPESDLERRIAGVWQELLGFDRVGVDDNFFELGGDSFVAVRTAARLKEALGVELPVAQLYEALTVRALARLVEEAGAADELRSAHLEERREAKSRRRDAIARRRERAGAAS